MKYAALALASLASPSLALTESQLEQAQLLASDLNKYIQKTDDHDSCAAGIAAGTSACPDDCKLWRYADGTSEELSDAGACDSADGVQEAFDNFWGILLGDSDECSMSDCEAGNCNRYLYNNGGGQEVVNSCNIAGAFQEAKDKEAALVAEAAQDDIGQLIIQLESVLTMRQKIESLARSSSGGAPAASNAECMAHSNAAVQEACENNGIAYGSLVNWNGCECTCGAGLTADQIAYGYSDYRCIAPADGELDSELATIKRFKNLKAMVMSMQPPEVTIFGRYCYYGCWCLPNGQHNLAAGYGAPVDPIDQVCKEFALCYKCIELDFGGACQPEKRGYRWGPHTTTMGVVYDVYCKDDATIGPTHRCKRYTCECDRVLAVGLAATWAVWNESFHARWGSFDREANCESDCGQNCYPQDDCCGAYGSASSSLSYATTRRPYATTNPSSGCCQDVFYYDVNTHVCCVADDGTVTVEEDGSCVGTEVDPDQVDDFDQNYPGYSKK